MVDSLSTTSPRRRSSNESRRRRSNPDYNYVDNACFGRGDIESFRLQEGDCMSRCTQQRYVAQTSTDSVPECLMAKWHQEGSNELYGTCVLSSIDSSYQCQPPMSSNAGGVSWTREGDWTGFGISDPSSWEFMLLVNNPDRRRRRSSARRRGWR